MRIILVLVLTGVILALDWAALDDITAGMESSYEGGYGILLVSLIILSALGFVCKKNHDYLDPFLPT